MKKIKFTILLILIWLPALISAQSDPTAVLEYFEDPYGDMIVTDDTGNALEYFDLGEILPPGFSISTGGGFAEIRLEPNGTILKLAEDTDFSITNLQGHKGSPSNEFSLLAGKMRTIAAKTTGFNYYNVRTPTAVMGVRGTDFINEVGPTAASVVVREGLVEVIPFSGTPVMVAENQSVDTLSDIFQTQTLPPEQVQQMFQAMTFKGLSPADVPGHTALPPAEEAVTESTEPAEEKKEESTAVTPEPVEELTTEDLAAAQESTPSADTSATKDSKLAEALRDFFGMEIGTTTIDGHTYSKVIVQPTLNLAKLKLGLYLPVIYTDNMFDPAQWYKPQGNDEWSFGTDQGGKTEYVLLDILKDTMLKLKFIEYGTQGWDPFYLKVGNLNNMSIGHGTIMNNYANDSEFPAIRKIGLNMGFDVGVFGMELVGNDLADPSIFGSRLFLNPIKSYEAFQIGLTGITDLFPAGVVSEAEASVYGDPWLIAFGMDLELLKINRDNFKLMLFGDFSTMMTVFREETSLDGIVIEPGATTELWLNDGTLKNYGIIGGLRGSILKFNWALEFRMSTGIYKPTLFNAVYDRNKIEYLSEIIHYMDSPSDKGTVMGIYGEGGFSLKDKLALTLGYFWPWELTNGNVSFNYEEDNFKISLVFMEGLIPRFPLNGSISYERTGLISTFKSGDITLFDGNTVVSGELIYPLARTLDLVIGASTVIQTDNEGNVIMDDNGLTPKIAPVINFETRIHF